MNGYIGNDNREQNERRTDMGGTNSHMGLQLPINLTGGTVFFPKHPGETVTQQRGNSLLRVNLNITIFPSKSLSGFRNRSPGPVTPSM